MSGWLVGGYVLGVHTESPRRRRTVVHRKEVRGVGVNSGHNECDLYKAVLMIMTVVVVVAAAMLRELCRKP